MARAPLFLACAVFAGCGGSGGRMVADLGPPALTCDYYCAVATSNCVDANRQYGDAADEALSTCMNDCTRWGWASGALGDTTGDTLGCRVYHAGAAAADPVTHCPHAGPLGGSACGPSQCDDFCAADAVVCGTTAYATTTDCLAACAMYADAPGPIASPTLSSGNTLSCRTYHLGAASTGVASDVAFHCPHTSQTGTGVCTSGPR